MYKTICPPDTAPDGPQTFEQSHNYRPYSPIPVNHVDRDTEGRLIWADTGIALSADAIAMVEDRAEALEAIDDMQTAIENHIPGSALDTIFENVEIDGERI